MQGLKDFAEWATHPISGILVQKHKPLPAHIKKTFDTIAEDVNTQINRMSNKQILEEGRAHYENTRMSRRAFDILAGAVAGAFVGGGYTGVYSLFVKDESYNDKVKRIAVGAVTGALIMGGTLAAVSTAGKETFVELPPIEEKYPVNQRSRHIAADFVCDMAVSSLEELSKPKQRSKTH